MEKMEVDDVVDLSIGSGRDSLIITPATARDLRALTQNSGLTITPAPPPLPPPPPPLPMSQPQQLPPRVSITQDDNNGRNRRVLRPRTEPRSYAESPDIILLPSKVNGKQINGNIDSDDDEEMPPILPIKELSAGEIWERERSLRKLREELRNEETKLVLLKKLKQSQQMMKENLIVTPTNILSGQNNVLSSGSLSVTPSQQNPLSVIPAALTKGSLSVTPSINPMPQPAHKNRPAAVLRGQPTPGRAQNLFPPPRSSLPGGATLIPGGPPHRSSLGHSRTSSNLTITPSVTITPTSAPPAGSKPRNVSTNNISSSVSITPAPSSIQSTTSGGDQNERSASRDDGQTPAQRQAAAKLALRKQLEKTLLQIPPPKPPPPEMHFIPNPSNTEFVYLLGLEHVVDYLTKEKRGLPPPQPFRCCQCKIDFTPVWKIDKIKDVKVICEQCVTSNVKKALKAEHTNRLKTAFVKALQQEQEIEQRLANQTSPSPMETHQITTPISIQPPPSVTVAPVKSQTPTPIPRPTQTPPTQQTPPPSASNNRSLRHDNNNTPTQSGPSSSSSNSAAVAAAAAAAAASSSSSSNNNFDKFPQLNALGNLANLGNLQNLGNLSNLSNLMNTPGAAAAMQAFHQQLFRSIASNPHANVANVANMMQFTPLLYSYQLAMAQAAQAVASGKNSNMSNMTNMADIQRAAEIQRQYLLEMIPPPQPGPSNNRQNNWKT